MIKNCLKKRYLYAIIADFFGVTEDKIKELFRNPVKIDTKKVKKTTTQFEANFKQNYLSEFNENSKFSNTKLTKDEFFKMKTEITTIIEKYLTISETKMFTNKTTSSNSDNTDKKQDNEIDHHDYKQNILEVCSSKKDVLNGIFINIRK